MRYQTLISVDELKDLIDAEANVLVLDCEFDLAHPENGPASFRNGHIPTARHAHLDHDLSGIADGSNGRHPLPDRDTFAAWLRKQGLNKDQLVVTYDSTANAGAARAWWLLRWMGHSNVAVLDGARSAWAEQGHELENGEALEVEEGNFEVGVPLVAGTVTAAEVLANIEAGDAQVLDARDPARFRGEPNPTDSAFGHIPGAKNRFFRDNMTNDGYFREAEELRAEFEALLDGKPAILQCGSGVTACQNALAMEIAGLPGSFLYPGSWSEWTSDPDRPIATGEN